MDAELMKSRIEKAVERYERKQMKARKNKVWSKINRGGKRIACKQSLTFSMTLAGSKINRGGKRIALRKPYQDEYLKDLREAQNANI